MENYFRVGVLTRPHGLKGEINVYPTTDDINRFKLLKRVFIDLASGKAAIKGSGLAKFEVEGVKFFKQTAIVKFKDIDSIDDISKYKGMDLLVAREDAVPLKEGEYYISDILGCKIITDNGEEYGTVVDVIETGANKVLAVKPDDAHGDLKEFYLPYIPDCILEVNITERFIRVYLMPGLLD